MLIAIALADILLIIACTITIVVLDRRIRVLYQMSMPDPDYAVGEHDRNMPREWLDENGLLAFWPYCRRCGQPFVFDNNEPLAYCGCGKAEWDYQRPAAYVDDPRALQQEIKRIRDQCDTCWGAANYRLKYLDALQRCLGMSYDNGDTERFAPQARAMASWLYDHEKIAHDLYKQLKPITAGRTHALSVVQKYEEHIQWRPVTGSFCASCGSRVPRPKGESGCSVCAP